MYIWCEIFPLVITLITKWSEDCGYCVQSYRWNYPLEYRPCLAWAEDQNLEVGRWLELSNGTKTLRPVDLTAWEHRQATMRNISLGRTEGDLPFQLSQTSLEHCNIVREREASGEAGPPDHRGGRSLPQPGGGGQHDRPDQAQAESGSLLC